MKKRLLCILLTFCMVMCLAPITALADNGNAEVNICLSDPPQDVLS